MSARKLGGTLDAFAMTLQICLVPIPKLVVISIYHMSSSSLIVEIIVMLYHYCNRSLTIIAFFGGVWP